MRAKVHDQVVAKDRGLRSGRSAALALAVALAALAGWPLHAAADVVIWDGGGTDTNWGTSANWSTDTVPATTDTAQFDSNTTATLEADHTIQGISLGANTLTLDGGNTLYLNTSGSENITGTGTLSISNGTTLDVRGRYHAGNESFVIEIAGSGVGGAGAIVNTSTSLVNANGFSNLRLTADATIGGTGRLDFGSGGFIDSQGYTLTKTGTNDVWLGSSAANTNLPFVDVVGGTFGLQGDNVLGSSSTVTVYSGGNLATWSNRQSNNNVVLDGGRLRSNNYNFGNLNATAVWNPGSAGVLAVLSDSSLYTYQANMTLNVPLSGSGNLTRSASSGTPSATYNAFGTENLTLNVSNGAWTGALTNNGGKVTIGHAEALGTSAVTHAFNAGSTLDLNGFDISTQPYTIQLAGTGIPIPVGDLASPTGYDPPGALVNSSYTAAAIGRVTLTADTTIGDGDIVFNGIVDGAFALTKMGSGTLTFNAANSWGGATNVEVGTVVVGTNNALPTTTTVTLGLDAQSATLQLDGNSQTLAGAGRLGHGHRQSGGQRLVDGRRPDAERRLDHDQHVRRYAGRLHLRRQ